jgi:hypothetical protein
MSPPNPYGRGVCDICCGYLNVGPIRTRDCGGTCTACMAIHGEDPEAIKALKDSPDQQDRDVLLVLRRLYAVRLENARREREPRRGGHLP